MNHPASSAKSLLAALTRLPKRIGGNHVARRGVTVFIIQVAGVGVAFATQIFIARIMGKEQYGIHATVLGWLAIFLLPAVGGMDTATLRFFSSYRESKNYSNLRGLVRFARQFVLATSLLSLGIAFGGVGGLYLTHRMAADVAICFAVGFTSIPVAAQLILNGRMLSACGKPALAVALLNLFRPMLIIFFVMAMFFLVSGGITAKESLAAYSVTSLILMLIGSRAIRSFRRAHHPVVPDAAYERRAWVKAALPLLLASSFQVVMRQCSIVMVGYSLGYEQAGIYAAANRMVELAAFGLTATNIVVAPMISAAYTSGRTDILKRSLQSAAATVFGLTIPLVAILLLAGKWGLGLFGEDFFAAYPALVILCVGQIVNAFCGCVGYLMSMTGNERAAARILCCAAVVNVTLNALFIPIWGIKGAACATALTLVMWNVWMLVVVRKRLGMNPTVLGWASRKSS